jgi:hypothetical protein
MRLPRYRDAMQNFRDRLLQRRRMMQALGIRLPKALSVAEQDQVRQTLLHCTECESAENCASWLTSLESIGDAPDYCPNRDLFRALGNRS